jgi:hypothetical protein
LESEDEVGSPDTATIMERLKNCDPMDISTSNTKTKKKTTGNNDDVSTTTSVAASTGKKRAAQTSGKTVKKKPAKATATKGKKTSQPTMWKSPRSPKKK